MFVLPSQLESIARRIVFCHCEARRAEAISSAHARGLARAWPRSADSAGRPNQRLAFGGPPRTRPAQLARGWSRADQRWIRMYRPGSDTGAETPPPLVGGVPRPAFDARLGSGPRHPSLNLGDAAPA